MYDPYVSIRNQWCIVSPDNSNKHQVDKSQDAEACADSHFPIHSLPRLTSPLFACPFSFKPDPKVPGNRCFSRVEWKQRSLGSKVLFRVSLLHFTFESPWTSLPDSSLSQVLQKSSRSHGSRNGALPGFP